MKPVNVRSNTLLKNHEILYVDRTALLLKNSRDIIVLEKSECLFWFQRIQIFSKSHLYCRECSIHTVTYTVQVFICLLKSTPYRIQWESLLVTRVKDCRDTAWSWGLLTTPRGALHVVYSFMAVAKIIADVIRALVAVNRRQWMVDPADKSA